MDLSKNDGLITTIIVKNIVSFTLLFSFFLHGIKKANDLTLLLYNKSLPVWASCTLFVGSIPISVSLKFLVDVDGGVIVPIKKFRSITCSTTLL